MNDSSTLFLDVSLAWGLIAFGWLIGAWWAARRGDTPSHRLSMILLTAGAWLFIAVYLLHYRYGQQAPRIPPEYIPWIALHGTIGLVPLFGATGLVWARLREKRSSPRRPGHLNRYHKAYGRVFVVLWCFTHAGGIVNFWLFR